MQFYAIAARMTRLRACSRPQHHLVLRQNLDPCYLCRLPVPRSSAPTLGHPGRWARFAAAATPPPAASCRRPAEDTAFSPISQMRPLKKSSSSSCPSICMPRYISGIVNAHKNVAQARPSIAAESSASTPLLRQNPPPPAQQPQEPFALSLHPCEPPDRVAASRSLLQSNSIFRGAIFHEVCARQSPFEPSLPPGAKTVAVSFAGSTDRRCTPSAIRKYIGRGKHRRIHASQPDPPELSPPQSRSTARSAPCGHSCRSPVASVSLPGSASSTSRTLPTRVTCAAAGFNCRNAVRIERKLRTQRWNREEKICRLAARIEPRQQLRRAVMKASLRRDPDLPAKQSSYSREHRSACAAVPSSRKQLYPHLKSAPLRHLILAHVIVHKQEPAVSVGAQHHPRHAQVRRVFRPCSTGA